MAVVLRYLPYNSLHGKLTLPFFLARPHLIILSTFVTIRPTNSQSIDYLPRLWHLHVLRFAYGAHGLLGLFLHSRD